MIDALANHLWQSTVFGLAVGLLAFACRRNLAGVRYGLWCCASIKFLVPFALLAGIGSHLVWTPSATPPLAVLPGVSSAVVRMAQPFGQMSPAPVAVRASSAREPASGWPVRLLAGLALSGTAALVLVRIRQWRRIRAVVRASTPWTPRGIALPPGLRVRAAPGLLEPGVVGVWQPVLLVPRDIEQHLTPAQLETVLAHEMCHVRRRDNLTATIHMVVETTFWFHPLVWWIGARLIEERERACDEEVLRTYGEPRTYAEGIVNVCRRYVRVPIVHVSGVGGPHVRSRVEAIMSNRIGRRLTVVGRTALACAAIAAIALPVGAGAIGTPASAADAAPAELDVVSVRAGSRPQVTVQPGRMVVDLPLRNLVGFAFGLWTPTPRERQIEGWPDPLLPERRFELTATLSGASRPTLAEQQRLVREILEDRFGMRARIERREQSVYALRLIEPGVLGPGIVGVDYDCTDHLTRARKGRLDCPHAGSHMEERGHVDRGSGPIEALVALLQGNLPDRVVVDQTGLDGFYDWSLLWMERGVRVSRPPSVHDVLGVQLGMTLADTRAPVDVIVLEAISTPTPD